MALFSPKYLEAENNNVQANFMPIDLMNEKLISSFNK